MAASELTPDTVAATFGLAAGVAIGASAIVAGVSRALGRRRRRRGASGSPRLRWLEENERRAARVAVPRAVGVAVALVAIVAASPWLGPVVTDLGERWVDAAKYRGWVYALAAAAVWIGLTPLAIVLWALPRAGGRDALGPTARLARGGAGTDPGLPTAAAPEELADGHPAVAALRRACRLRARNVALWATPRPDGRLSQAAGIDLVSALVVVPIVTTGVVAATARPWLAALVVAGIAAWVGAAYLMALRGLQDAPATAFVDYLILVAAARSGRATRAGELTVGWFARNPGTQQDHEALVRMLTESRWLAEPAWDPVSVRGPEVAIPITLPMTDRAGAQRALRLTVRLRRDRDAGWRIIRVVTEQVVARPDARPSGQTPVSAAWG